MTLLSEYFLTAKKYFAVRADPLTCVVKNCAIATNVAERNI